MDEAATRRLLALEQRLTDLERVEVGASGARVYNSANQSIANTTETVVAFDSERFDDANYHSTSVNTGRFTIPAPGRHHVGMHLRWAANGTGDRYAYFRLNGATNIGLFCIAGNAFVSAMSFSTYYNFDAGDAVEVIVYQSSGGALNLTVNANHSPEFWIYRV